MDTTLQNKPYEYFAFISYKREDEKWAKWLQKKLESYSLPTALRKENPHLPAKIRPIFRDQSELSGGNLKAEIEKGLNSSKYLIVICSPRSAKSPWVSKEVQHFIDNGKENYIIPFIIGGAPNASKAEDECFPEGLRQLNGEKEILGININEMGREAAAIKVIARMFDLRFDSLWQRHEKEKRNKRLLFGLLSAIVVLFLLGIVGYISKQNERLSLARDRANQERYRAEVANRDLATANDSIIYQSKLLAMSNDSLTMINDVLAATIRDLDIERHNVVLKTYDLQKEQLRQMSKQAESLFDEGNVLRSYQLLRPMAIEIINRRYPYSPEVASLINKIKWYLNKDGYKVVEQLIASDNDSLYHSPNLQYNPYTERGKFYLRDIVKGLTIVLPGEDRTEGCDFQFGNNTLYYRGYYNSYLWDIINEELIKFPFSYYSNKDNYEYFMTYTLPDITVSKSKYIYSYDDIPNIIDYNIRNIVEDESKYLVSSDANEILVKNNLLSKRVLPISFDSGLVGPLIDNNTKDIYMDSIVYSNLTWYKIDEKGPLRLYKSYDYADDTRDAKLLLKNEMDYSNSEFTPFVAYNSGNGIGYLKRAFILNEDEILCVSGQDNHKIYNIRLNMSNDFQSGIVDSWKMGHPGLHLAGAFLLDKNTLCDVRCNGQITIYDIPTRLVIDEYDIPIGGWLKNGKMSGEVLYKDNRIIIIFDDCSYKITLVDKLQSLSEDINLIDQFWD